MARGEGLMGAKLFRSRIPSIPSNSTVRYPFHRGGNYSPEKSGNVPSSTAVKPVSLQGCLSRGRALSHLGMLQPPLQTLLITAVFPSTWFSPDVVAARSLV